MLVVVSCVLVQLGLEWGLCFVQGVVVVVGWIQNRQVEWWYLQNFAWRCWVCTVWTGVGWLFTGLVV
jgi:hypothetical protein